MAIKKITAINKILLFLFFLFFFISNYAFSATLSIVPVVDSCSVGDTIRVKVLVNSENPINAVSSEIIFPKEYLTMTSFSHTSSIINFWAQAPSFSNDTGKISFEGVILNGFTGQAGNILTFNFKAKKEGIATIGFVNASVLANDGNGTETISGTKPGVFEIKSAPILPKKEKEEQTIKECLSELPEITEVRTQQIETSCNLPKGTINSFVIPVTIFILFAVLFFFIYYIRKIKKFLRNKIYRTDDSINQSLGKLENEIEEELGMLAKEQNKEANEKRVNSLIGLEKEVKDTKEEILKEIKDIERDL